MAARAPERCHVPGHVAATRYCARMRLRQFYVTVFALLAIIWPVQAEAHVYITSPEQGAVLDPSTEVTITWSISVNHGPGDVYDIMFSADGGGGYEALAEGLGPETTSLQWTTPSLPTSEGRLVVMQHGADNYTFMDEVGVVIGGDEEDMGVVTTDAGSTDAGSTDAGSTNNDAGTSSADLVSLPDATTASDQGVQDVPTTGEEVLAMLQSTCAVSGCHTGTRPQVQLDLNTSSFPENMVGQHAVTTASTDRIAPCRPDDSALIQRVRGLRTLRMPPPPEPEFPEAVIAALETWIGAGAPASGSFSASDAQSCVADSSEGDLSDEGCSVSPSGRSRGLWLGLGLVAVVLWRRGRARRPVG